MVAFVKTSMGVAVSVGFHLRMPERVEGVYCIVAISLSSLFFPPDTKQGRVVV